MRDQELYERLKELEVVELGALDQAYEASRKEEGELEEELSKRDLISDENLGRVLAEIARVPLVRLTEVAVAKEVLWTIPEVVAKKQRIIAFKKDKNGLHLAMRDPENIQVRDFVEKKAGLPVVVYLATKRDIENALGLYAKEITQTFDEIIAENVLKAAKGSEVEPPIIKIVDTVIDYANRNKASDIHIEPTEEETMIRFRIDGVLHDVLKIPKDLHYRIVTRIKVMSRLRTDEHQAPQDGKIRFEAENLDIRVSIVPILNGEKVVMRLLSENSRQYSLADLGFSPSDLEKTEAAYKKPHGMILSTGPTGCGKTTTMYAMLKILNRREVNIMTIEDPIEYEIDGVNQIQVNQKTGLTFAEGLRSILRQDPNIMLVGEIRDEDTAGIAINSAMTGHLVLSTLHTNDAATAIPRLFDMGIEPFLVASSVNLIIAQRLVRKICSKCRVSQEIKADNEMLSSLSKELRDKFMEGRESQRAYVGKGCEVCHQSGYVGRMGLYEVMLLSDRLREAVVGRMDAAEIKKLAIAEGMTTMLEDGLLKIKSGITTLAEVLRVTKE